MRVKKYIESFKMIVLWHLMAVYPRQRHNIFSHLDSYQVEPKPSDQKKEIIGKGYLGQWLTDILNSDGDTLVHVQVLYKFSLIN